MENTIQVIITLNGMDALFLVETLNPDATFLYGADFTVKGTNIDGGKPADTKLGWRPPNPIVIPKEK